MANYPKAPSYINQKFWQDLLLSLLAKLNFSSPISGHMKAIEEAGYEVQKIQFLQKSLMERFPLWTRFGLFHTPRPPTLPTDCDWETGVDSFRILSVDVRTWEVVVKCYSISSDNKTSTRQESFVLPEHLRLETRYSRDLTEFPAKKNPESDKVYSYRELPLSTLRIHRSLDREPDPVTPKAQSDVTSMKRSVFLESLPESDGTSCDSTRSPKNFDYGPFGASRASGDEG